MTIEIHRMPWPPQSDSTSEVEVEKVWAECAGYGPDNQHHFWAVYLSWRKCQFCGLIDPTPRGVRHTG